MPSGDVRAYIIWEPILQADWTRPTSGVLARVADTRAQQYWDPGHLTAAKMAEALKADPQHPEPRCCTSNDILWDLIAVYPRGVTWNTTLPRATYIDGPVWELSQLPAEVKKQLTPTESPQQ